MTRSLAILGTVGVPGTYGGFETLAENLVTFHESTARQDALTVYCSGKAYADQPAHFKTAHLVYLPLQANGAQSIPYDIWSLFHARRNDTILLLGVSGALVLPLIRLISRARIITNIDGIEWRREKWKGLAKWILRASEWAAVRFSHEVVADNRAIAEYVDQSYGAPCHVIAYGGDNALAAAADRSAVSALPERYALALCRIEPENNIAMILEAWAGLTAPSDLPLVFVGNWSKSDYGRDLRQKYSAHPQIHLLDPVYEPTALRAIRDRAVLYVHGHSAGGTNPSLVEMMHFAIPVLAHGCNFNRYTTEERARYFMSANELADAARGLSSQSAEEIGDAMQEIAKRRYTWDAIGKAYFDLADG